MYREVKAVLRQRAIDSIQEFPRRATNFPGWPCFQFLNQITRLIVSCAF